MVEEILVFILLLFIHRKIQYLRNIKKLNTFHNEIQNKDQIHSGESKAPRSYKVPIQLILLWSSLNMVNLKTRSMLLVYKHKPEYFNTVYKRDGTTK